MRETVVTKTVPGTDITVTIERQPADPELAELLKRRPHLARDFWHVTRQPGSATFVNYLATGRPSEEEARAEANFLWADAVQRRNAHSKDHTAQGGQDG